MNLSEKFRETVSSVLPIMIIVLFLSLTIAPLGMELNIRFIVGGLILIFGLTLFLAGVDIGILPVGERCGAALTSKQNLFLLLGVSFVIGLMVTIAEPDVQVLAEQIKGGEPSVQKLPLVIMIALGVGFFIVLGLIRTVFSIKLKYLLTVCYVLLFMLAFASPGVFQGVAFDAGGATTGPMTVPFIMALGAGVASVRAKGRGSGGSGGTGGDDSFGLTGIASIGPIVAVCIYGIYLYVTGRIGGEATCVSQAVMGNESASLSLFLELIPEKIKEVSIALLPLAVMFAVFQFFLLKMPPVQVRRMIQGLIYSYIGLVIFLVGASGGFMPAGEKLGILLGQKVAGSFGYAMLLVFVGFLFGAVVVCAEPAVWVLTEQVESVSEGMIKRNIMLISLSFGVALSVGLSMLRLVYGFSLWYILVPGYVLAIVLSYICPPLFVGIAFDSGGVASGPMTSTFILSFTIGAAAASGSAGGASDAFGVIALVAMTPLIAIQILGIMFKIKSRGAS